MVEIMVGHLLWSTRFLIWPSNVFEMVDEMKKKKFIHWILSLHTAKLYDPKLIHFAWLIINHLKHLGQASQNNSFCHHCKCSYKCAIYYQFHNWAVNLCIYEFTPCIFLQIKTKFEWLRCNILFSVLTKLIETAKNVESDNFQSFLSFSGP